MDLDEPPMFNILPLPQDEFSWMYIQNSVVFRDVVSSLLHDLTWFKCLAWNKADSWPTFFYATRSAKDLDLPIPSLSNHGRRVACLQHGHFPVWWESRRMVESESVSSGVHCAMAARKCSKEWCSMWPEKLSNCMMIKWFASNDLYLAKLMLQFDTLWPTECVKEQVWKFLKTTLFTQTKRIGLSEEPRMGLDVFFHP